MQAPISLPLHSSVLVVECSGQRQTRGLVVDITAFVAQPGWDSARGAREALAPPSGAEPTARALNPASTRVAFQARRTPLRRFSASGAHWIPIRGACACPCGDLEG